jgi:hypothetical protein
VARPRQAGRGTRALDVGAAHTPGGGTAERARVRPRRAGVGVEPRTPGPGVGDAGCERFGPGNRPMGCGLNSRIPGGVSFVPPGHSPGCAGGVKQAQRAKPRVTPRPTRTEPIARFRVFCQRSIAVRKRELEKNSATTPNQARWAKDMNRP